MCVAAPDCHAIRQSGTKRPLPEPPTVDGSLPPGVSCAPPSTYDDRTSARVTPSGVSDSRFRVRRASGLFMVEGPRPAFSGADVRPRAPSSPSAPRIHRTPPRSHGHARGRASPAGAGRDGGAQGAPPHPPFGSPMGCIHAPCLEGRRRDAPRRRLRGCACPRTFSARVAREFRTADPVRGFGVAMPRGAAAPDPVTIRKERR